MYAQNLTSTMYDMMNQNRYPDYVVPAREIHSLPLETFSETEIGLSVRMEKLEKAVQELVRRPAGPPNQAGYLAAALERGRSLSQRRVLTAARATTPVRLGGVEAAALPGVSIPAEEDQSTYADRVKRTRQDDEGFVLQGRKRRQNVAKGSSKVDLSDELGESVSAPLLFYVGNTNLPVTKEFLNKVLVKCAAKLEGTPELQVLEVEEANKDLQFRRTKSWKVTVPYSMKSVMENSELYPPG